MVSKNQSLGRVILFVCLVVAIGYIGTMFYPQWLVTLGLFDSTGTVRFWLIAVPVLLAFAILIYDGVWFGCMNATGLPPRLIERIKIIFKRRKEESNA